jgi:hypothetical protein
MSAKFRSLAGAVLSDGELDAVEGAVSAIETNGMGPLIASISAVGVR